MNAETLGVDGAHHRVLVVDRLAVFGRFEKAIGSRPCHVGLRHDEVFRRYRGIDGEPWPLGEPSDLSFLNDTVSLPDWDAAKRYARAAGSADIIAFGPDSGPVLHLPEGESGASLRRLGFDLGVFQDRYAQFSVVLNEVVFGGVASVAAFARELNEHLLLPSLAAAAQLDVVRRAALADQEDLEQMDSPFGPIAIYG